MEIYSINECREFINKLNKEFIENLTKEQERDLLVEANNVEKRDVSGYHGRELLELLQNADDAYQKSISLKEKPTDELVVKIRYFDNKLTVSNTGTFFDKDGIKAIVQSNNSSKDEEYIGNKGTGFRSVLNWADKVRIFSGNFNIEFSKDIANKFFEQIKDTAQIKKQLKKHPNLHMPMLSVGNYLDEKPSEYLDNETTVELTINPDKQKDEYNVYDQIRKMDMNILLFLPNTAKIQIETKDKKITYKREKKIIESNDKFDVLSLSITKIDNGEEQTQDYKLFEKTIEDSFKNTTTGIPEQKKLKMAIATVDDKTTLQNTHLYTYFPLLDTEASFNCIMHATYELGNQRNVIDRSSNNEKIIVHQLKFLLDIAQNYFIRNHEVESAINLITPNNIKMWNRYNKHFRAGFSSFNLEDEYLKKLKEVKVFQTVNGDLLSISDNPKMIGEKIPDYFKGKNFDFVLKLHNENEFLLLNLLKDYFNINLGIDENELSKIISNESVNWSISQQVDCFRWWCERFPKKILPSLLKTREDDWFKFNDVCYFLDGDFEDVNIPSWTKIVSLDEKYQEELLNQAAKDEKILYYKIKEPKNTTSRIISQHEEIYPCIQFKYLDKSSIISAINSSVKTYQNSVEFVKWLWKNYQHEEQDWLPPGIIDNKIKYKFPTFEGNIASSEEIFLSSEYNNKLGDKLFDENYKQFCSISELGITPEQIEYFVNFIRKFGVNMYPKITNTKVVLEKDYYNYICDVINKNTYKADSTYIKELNCYFPFITNLTNILENNSTTDILYWIKNDFKLANWLQKKELSQYDYKIEFILNRGVSRPYTATTVKNYMLYVFNHTKWIEIDGNKYSPVEVLIDIYSRNNQLFKDLVPVITDSYKKEVSEKLDITIEQLHGILCLFDFKTSVLDLSSNDFYGILLKLPQLNNRLQSIDIYKSIYYLLDHTDISNLDFEDSNNKQLFFKEGKLLTQKKEFVLASEVYLPSTKILNKNKYNIINKPPRGNSENFIKVFGCKKYEREFKINSKSIIESSCNENFQVDFQNFKSYANSYNSLNKNIEKNFKNITITLVQQISVEYVDGTIEEIKDEYIETSETLTKWYITVFSNDYNVNKLSVCIENIFSNIANTPGYDSGKVGEIFRAKTDEDRRFLVENSLGIIIPFENDFASEYESQFEKAIRKIDDNVDVKSYNIDFNNINCDSNIEKLLNLAKNLKINSLDEIYNNGFDYKFNLTNYYKTEIRNYIEKEKYNFKNDLYSKALNDEKMQKGFLETCRNFENFNIKEDVYDILDIENLVKKEFGVWEKDVKVDAKECYQTNYDKLNPNNELEDNISNDDKVKEFIYFNKKAEFDNWMTNIKTEIEKESFDKKDPYENYRDCIPQEEKISYSKIKETKHIEQNHRKGVFVESNEQKKRKNQKILGNKGELLIYNLLNSMHDKVSKVYPKSEAFVTLKILKAGQGESSGCDIEYDGTDGERYYVEVKSGDEFSFNISPEELEFAKEHGKNYKLYIVYDLDTEKPKCKLVDDEFWENEKYTQKEIIETIHISF